MEEGGDGDLRFNPDLNGMTKSEIILDPAEVFQAPGSPEDPYILVDPQSGTRPVHRDDGLPGGGDQTTLDAGDILYQEKIPDPIMIAVVESPESEGYGVLDTGATETVGSLTALERIVLGRRHVLGVKEEIKVVPAPLKSFKFGKGATRRARATSCYPRTLETGAYFLASTPWMRRASPC